MFSLHTICAAVATAAALFSSPVFSRPYPTNSSSMPTVYTLPGNNTHPEDVALQPGTNYFYTVSGQDGTIYRGNLYDSKLEPFIYGSQFNMTLGYGIKLYNNQLYVASGALGTMFVFSLETRKLTHRFYNGLGANATLLNDLAIDEVTGDVYVTDSTASTLWIASGEAVGSKKVEQTLEPFMELAPTVVYQADAYNGNGIVITPGREYIMFSSTVNRALYRITRKTKEIQKIDFGGVEIAMVDGLVYEPPLLYIVNGIHTVDGVYVPATNYINVVEFVEPYLEGKVLGNITSPLLDRTSTAAVLPGGQSMLAVNYQGEFLTNPDLPFTIARIPVKW